MRAVIRRSRSSGEGIGDKWVGMAVVGVVIVVLAVFGIIYTRPPDQRTISFQTTDASAIESGGDVRVAGVSVGKVSSVDLGGDFVTVRARIDAGMWIGDATRVEVRMRTPVGGYSINLVPAGRSESYAMIPAGRVTVPYSIGDVLQQVPRVTDDVNASTINANLAQVANALEGNSTSLRSITDGLNSIATVFDRQRSDLDRVADLAAEYLRTFNANRDFVFTLINKIDTVVTTYNINAAGFNYTYFLLGQVLTRLIPFEKFYLNHSDLVRGYVYQVRDALQAWQKQLNPAIDGLMTLRDQLSRFVGPEGMRTLSAKTVDLGQLCIPVPGKDC